MTPTGPAGVEPALPGTYGEASPGHRLPDATELGRVVLQVSDLARSQRFYEQVLGFRVIRSVAGTALLGAHMSDRPLVELRERVGAKPLGRRGKLGLFHFAILLPDRPALARFVRHLAELGVQAGAGDHVVSEAFYLSDPDGLGIEVYADRPRDTWTRVGRQLVMGTDPVDVDGLLRDAGPLQWVGMPSGTVIGHVHLHVGDLARASGFYHEAVGFDRMVWGYPGALFLGAGGYHHHLGANTWAGSGASAAAEDEARLVEWTVEVPTLAAVDAVAVSVAKAGFEVRRDEDDAVLRDPWGTALRVTSLRAG